VTTSAARERERLLARVAELRELDRLLREPAPVRPPAPVPTLASLAARDAEGGP